jgi:hypothetical protein
MAKLLQGKGKIMLVARPAGVYIGNVTKRFDWLAAQKRATHFRQSCNFLASKNGLRRRANVTPALTTPMMEHRNG